MMIILAKKPKQVLLTSKQNGTTMVSLIVGMALSAFLLTAVLQIFTATRNNYKLSQNIAEMNDAMRYAVNRMYNMISYTGQQYLSGSSLPSMNTTFPTFTRSSMTCTSSSTFPGYVIPSFNTGLANGQKDQPVFLLQGDGNNNDLYVDYFTDCVGNPITPAGSLARVQFYASSSNLVCNTLNSSGNVINTTNLISNLVYGMWVQYGYDTNNDGNIDYYYNYNSATTPTNANRIRAVRISIILHSRDDVLAKAQNQTFSLWGQPITVPTTPDRKLYKLHVFTVPFDSLPNPFPY